MSKSTADVVIKVLTALTVFGLILAGGLYEPYVDLINILPEYIDDAHTKVSDVALMILRAALGMMIFVHGYNKTFRGGRIAGTGRWFQSMGMRPGKVHAALAAFTEMGVGALLVVGLITQVAAAGLIGLMVVAFWTVHRDKGFMITGEGWEYVALISVMSLVCAMLGPGPHLPRRRPRHRRPARRLDRHVDRFTAGRGCRCGPAAALLPPPAPRARRRWLMLRCRQENSCGTSSGGRSSGVAARRWATPSTGAS